MIGLIDCGIGNVRSVSNSLKYLNIEHKILANSASMVGISKLIFPGVGAFEAGMASLRSSGFDLAIKDFAREARPVLGICLGMQLLFSKSYENGEYTGLDLIPGEVKPLKKFDSNLVVPHVGWNNTLDIKDNILMKKSDDYYFVHSYYCLPDSADDIIAFTDYGEKFPSVVKRGSIYGVQFHPEKSQTAGFDILKEFSEIKC